VDSDDAFLGGDLFITNPSTAGVQLTQDAGWTPMNSMTIGDVTVEGSPSSGPVLDNTGGAVPIAYTGELRTPGAPAVYNAGNVDTLWNPFRGSNVSTIPWQLTVKNTVAGTSGSVFSMAAVVRETGTYSQIRFGIGTAAPGGTYTDCRAGVWNAAGTTKLADTGDLHATVIAANTLYTVALGSTLTLYAGQVVYLGVGFIASTAPNILGFIVPTGIMAATPLRSGSTAGFTTGNPLPAAVNIGGNTSSMIWAELLH
jgi:hypothetical protein